MICIDLRIAAVTTGGLQRTAYNTIVLTTAYDDLAIAFYSLVYASITFQP